MKRRLVNGQGFFERRSIAWQQAMRFNEFYALLYDKLVDGSSDEVLIAYEKRCTGDGADFTGRRS